jgi:hypothetical protein
MWLAGEESTSMLERGENCDTSLSMHEFLVILTE